MSEATDCGRSAAVRGSASEKPSGCRRALALLGTAVLTVSLLLVWAGVAGASSWELQRVATPSLRAGAEVQALFALDGGTAWVAGAGNAVHNTHDGGRSWIAESTSAPASTVWRAVHFVDRRHGFVAGADGRTGLLYATADGGATWAERLRLPGTRLSGLEFNGAEMG